MPLKFRKSLKSAPGIRLNLTHRGVSTRLGPRAVGYTVSADGRQHVSAGIPGTGIYVSEQIKPPRRKRGSAQGGKPLPIPR